MNKYQFVILASSEQHIIQCPISRLISKGGRVSAVRGRKIQTAKNAVALRVGLAVVALLFGLTIYYVDRSGFMVIAPWLSGIRATSGSASWGGNVPAFTHTFAFILLLSVAMPPQTRTFWVVLVWMFVECLFELLQLRPLAMQTISVIDSVGAFPGSRTLRAYVEFGTFDILDLGGIGLGGACAHLVIGQTKPPIVSWPLENSMIGQKSAK